MTASFSQFKIVALSMLPRLTDAHEVNINVKNNKGIFILMFSIII